MPDWKLVDLPMFSGDSRGGILSVAEVSKVTCGAFGSAKRVYFIANHESKAIVRGGHYHPDGGKLEFMFVPIGLASAELHSASGCDECVFLDAPKEKAAQGIFIPANVWHRVKIYPNSVLVSIASTNFDPSEAIADLPSCACKKAG